MSVNSGLQATKIIGQRKAFYRQRIPEFSCARKETVDIDILVTSRNGQEKLSILSKDYIILVTGFAKMTAPSFINLAGKLSITGALQMSMFFNSFRTISSVIRFNWNLMVIFKSL